MGLAGLIVTRQAMCCTVKRSIEARSRNHCCSGKGISITYSECVSVTVVIHYAVRVRHIVTCGLCGCTVFFPIIIIMNGRIWEN